MRNFQKKHKKVWKIKKCSYLCNPKTENSYGICGNSSVGRAQPCQGWGREFESRFPLQKVSRNADLNYETPDVVQLYAGRPLLRRLFLLYISLVYYSNSFRISSRFSSRPNAYSPKFVAGSLRMLVMQRSSPLNMVSSAFFCISVILSIVSFGMTR